MDLSEDRRFSYIFPFPNVSSKGCPHNDNFENSAYWCYFQLYVNYYSGWLLSCRECWPDTQILNALKNQDFQALLEPNPHLLPSPPLGIMGSFGPVSAIFFSTHFPVWNLNFTELKMPLGRKFHHLHRAGGRGRREGTKLGVVSQMLRAVLRTSLFQLTRFWSVRESSKEFEIHSPNRNTYKTSKIRRQSKPLGNGVLVLSCLRKQFNMTVPRICKLSFSSRPPSGMPAHNSLELSDVG